MLILQKKTGTPPGWGDLSGASYDSISKSLLPEAEHPNEVRFNTAGTKMFVLATPVFTQPRVFQYTLSSAWDVSTASYDSVLFNVTSEDVNPKGLAFKPDGTIMYVSGEDSNAIYQYTVSTPWDMSTASYASKTIGTNTFPSSLAFRPDGTRMFVVELFASKIQQYNLSVAWDLSTATFDTDGSLGLSANGEHGLAFKDDGTKCYVNDDSVGYDRVYQYSLSTAWDITSISIDVGESISVLAQDTGTTGVTFSTSGHKMYVVGQENDAVYQYTTT